MTKQSTKDFFKEYFSKEEPKKKLFKPNIEEDLNRPHKVTLTEGQISTILYILEGYNPLDANGYDPEFREDIDKIFEELEGVVDTYYNNKGYKMQLSLTQFQADIIKNSLKLYDIEMLSTSEEWREYDNLFDKLAELSDTSRADDFYKQSPLNRNGKDLDSL